MTTLHLVIPDRAAERRNGAGTHEATGIGYRLLATISFMISVVPP